MHFVMNHAHVHDLSLDPLTSNPMCYHYITCLLNKTSNRKSSKQNLNISQFLGFAIKRTITTTHLSIFLKPNKELKRIPVPICQHKPCSVACNSFMTNSWHKCLTVLSFITFPIRTHLCLRTFHMPWLQYTLLRLV